MRINKHRIRTLLESENWRENISVIAAAGMAAVGPLFSFLLLKPEIMHRAACALGATVAELANNEPETAKNVIRRFMWHMNEESGNIGWGIPDAFAECLCASPMLAQTYYNILISYIIDLGHDDNYCDNDILRRSCYWAIGRFAQARPNLAEKARPYLVKGLNDVDSICRGMAAWALAQLPAMITDVPPLRKLAESGDTDICEIFNGIDMIGASVCELARQALEKENSA